MSSVSKNICESGEVVEENISPLDENDDTSASAETYEAARQFEDAEESKKQLGSASDADVSNLSSSDSVQTVSETDVDKQLGIGSKLQRSPRQNFETMKFEECQVKLVDDESSDEKDSKLSARKSKKSPRKSTCEAIEITAGCSAEQGQITETGSKRALPDSDIQVDFRHSASEPVTISVQDIVASSAEKPCEVTTKKITPRKYTEKIKKTRLGSSEIGADVIEDAIDHTDDSVFTTVGSSDFITSNMIPTTEIVTDITEDAIDNTDQEVFTKISLDPVFTDVSSFILDAGKAVDATKDCSDQAGVTQIKFSDTVDKAVSNIMHKEMSHTSLEGTEQNVQIQSHPQALDFQEVISGKVFSATASAILDQASQPEVENVSDITTHFLNIQNIDIEKTESSIDSNPSDDRMEFSSASTIPSVIEKMECSNDTYSGFENFKIDSESNATLEKMDCKSESSTSHDKMDTDSLSLKSNETEGMEYSCDSLSRFEQKSINVIEKLSTSVPSESTSAQEKEFVSLQERQFAIVEESDSISLQEREPLNVHENESVVVQESESVSKCESIGRQECPPIGGQVCESIGGQVCESIGLQENESITSQLNESISVSESKLISVQDNESISNQQTQPISDQENKSLVVEQEDSSTLLLDSVSCLIGDFVSRTIQETVSENLQESLGGLLDKSTFSHALTDIKCSIESDSSSNEIKAIYESNISPESVSERTFAIPRKEASDTEEYDYEQKQVSDKEVDTKRSSCGETSLKRRNSTEDEQTGETADVEKPSTSCNVDPQNATGSNEFKDSDDKKGHKKLKK
ncbi:hypothetical protein JTE90_002139 [Oedothorax gibbosus]|uniref:Uncharacterized protein n=1 Tax=Oedothorax gibbosus TaxID=931172 RepID=A0AAV6V9A8_9ARAC|nr:hypothetical protein JTE90_002139 [Oedothorax gibbosus]